LTLGLTVKPRKAPCLFLRREDKYTLLLRDSHYWHTMPTEKIVPITMNFLNGTRNETAEM
jgi:hypothetical protein